MADPTVDLNRFKVTTDETANGLTPVLFYPPHKLRMIGNRLVLWIKMFAQCSF